MNVKYPVHNMHGPTVYGDNDLEKAIWNAWRASKTGGYYTVHKDGIPFIRFYEGKEVEI